jgi:hypothetical protein
VKARFSTLLIALLAAGCVAPAPRRPPPLAPRPVLPPPVPDETVRDLASVMGRGARALADQFGTPGLDVREGDARKLQFLGPTCVLDIYLYPPRGGGDPVATHVDARLPDGRDTDRAECVAALSRR